MNNINIIKIFLPFVILGCAPNVVEENRVIQKINSLDMNVFSKKGDKIYSITSPDSNFDKIKLVFNLKKTTINIFNGKDIKYIVDADSSRLLDKNKIIELKGNVKLRSFNQNNDYLYGDNLIWNINESKYELIGNVRFENNNVFLYSNKAILMNDNIIEFFNPVKYIMKGDNNEKKYEINSENAFYNIDKESLSFRAKDKKVRSIIYF
jgi:lipopolysaccharide assembly outer membrane protein LptD (OstA)